MTEFTPLRSLIGGMMIGSSAIMVWLLLGRIAGISGITASLLSSTARTGWRVGFIISMVGTGIVASLFFPTEVGPAATRSPMLLVFAGLCVGFGTRLGSGCTSGHGVCGLSRFSKRSAAATATFMAVGILTVFVTRSLM